MIYVKLLTSFPSGIYFAKIPQTAPNPKPSAIDMGPINKSYTNESAKKSLYW